MVNNLTHNGGLLTLYPRIMLCDCIIQLVHVPRLGPLE